jgi:diguanylate cyclase (GGDEF)-like protein
VLETGEPLKGWRDTFFGADGRAVPVETFASALRSLTGDIDGLVVSFRDISKQQQLEGQLEYAAQHDSLTGAFNRHFFDALFEREHAHAARRGEPLSLMLLDVDHFKTVNDRYGHLVGDEVLKALVRHLAERLRGSDILARWGGEEFALLLPETTLDGAVALAESLRASVEHAELAAGLPPLTISIGVTRILSGVDLASSFHRADEALYRAKSSGRNRVCAV